MIVQPTSDGAFIYTCPVCGWSKVHPRLVRMNCRSCKGKKIVSHAGRAPVATRREDRSDCIHMDGPTDESVDVRNCSCGERLQRVWLCTIYGDCLPNARRESIVLDEAVRKCAACDDYQSPALAAPPGGGE